MRLATSPTKEKFKNTVPNTPSSASSMNDLLTSDPRRSSTPMNANAKSRKWRRSTSNAWAGAAGSKPQSPLGSPLSNQQTQSAASLFPVGPGSPRTEAKKFCPPPQKDPPHHKVSSSSTTDNVVTRRSGGRRTRTRPRSMVIQPVSVREKNSEIAIISRRAESFRTPSPHSDTELDVSESRNLFLAGLVQNDVANNMNFVDERGVRDDGHFNTDIPLSNNYLQDEGNFDAITTTENNTATSFVHHSPPTSPRHQPPTPIESRTPVKEIDIDDQRLQQHQQRSDESEAERVRRVAFEIDENVRHLKQQQQHQQQLLNSSHENIDEEELKDTKELIRLYETGLIGTNGKKLVSSSPPERDVPNAVSPQVRCFGK